MKKTQIPKREYNALLLLYPEGIRRGRASDAKKLGVRDRAPVSVVAAGGSMRVAVRISEGVKPGTVYVPYFIEDMVPGFLNAAGAAIDEDQDSDDTRADRKGVTMYILPRNQVLALTAALRRRLRSLRPRPPPRRRGADVRAGRRPGCDPDWMPRSPTTRRSHVGVPPGRADPVLPLRPGEPRGRRSSATTSSGPRPWSGSGPATSRAPLPRPVLPRPGIRRRGLPRPPQEDVHRRQHLRPAVPPVLLRLHRQRPGGRGKATTSTLTGVGRRLPLRDWEREGRGPGAASSRLKEAGPDAASPQGEDGRGRLDRPVRRRGHREQGLDLPGHEPDHHGFHPATTSGSTSATSASSAAPAPSSARPAPASTSRTSSRARDGPTGCGTWDSCSFEGYTRMAGDHNPAQARRGPAQQALLLQALLLAVQEIPPAGLRRLRPLRPGLPGRHRPAQRRHVHPARNHQGR
ncbi:MAG: hypothetical protein M0C28_07610 [Candidatus Moduliflexus flocculans]|nr:hypothetical protein [Candidatus Moduliflexus flocculans]